MADLRVIDKLLTVTAVNTVGSTFDAVDGDGVAVQGIRTDPQNLPLVGDSRRVMLVGARVVDLNAGLALASVGTPQISASGLNASTWAGGTFTSTVVAQGSILNALSGRRAGITPIGIQAFDDSGNVAISFDGFNNLMTGVTQTAIAGRRIVMGSGGTTGKLSFFSPNGAENLLESYTSSGVEVLRVGSPVDDAWEAWGTTAHQSNEKTYISHGEIRITFGGDASNKLFSVEQGTDSGSPGVQPTRVERIKADTTRSIVRSPDIDFNMDFTQSGLAWHVGATSSNGWIDVLPHGVSDSNLRSPKMIFRGEGGSTGAGIKHVAVSGGGSVRVEVVDGGDNYTEIWASGFPVHSKRESKRNIRSVQRSFKAIAADLTPREYQRVWKAHKMRPAYGNGPDVDVPERVGPTEIGLVVDEAPPEVVVGDREAIDLYGLATVGVGLGKENAADIDALDRKLTALIKKLGVVLP